MAPGASKQRSRTFGMLDLHPREVSLRGLLPSSPHCVPEIIVKSGRRELPVVVAARKTRRDRGSGPVPRSVFQRISHVLIVWSPRFQQSSVSESVEPKRRPAYLAYQADRPETTSERKRRAPRKSGRLPRGVKLADHTESSRVYDPSRKPRTFIVLSRPFVNNLDDTPTDMSESKIEIQHLEQGETVKQETTHLEHFPATTTYEYAADHAPRVRLATWLVLLVRDRPG